MFFAFTLKQGCSSNITLQILFIKSPQLCPKNGRKGRDGEMEQYVTGVILDFPVCILSDSLTVHWPVIESLTGDCLLEVSGTRLVLIGE